MTSDESNTTPIIYYTLIAFNTKIICEVNEHNNPTSAETKKKEKKYIRASKKILKKIEQYEIRRPDGMGTLISGTYSYNYIHGYEYCNNTNYPLLESLIFLCVLPLYQTNPNVTSTEREIAFNFLSSVRRDFLTSFAQSLQYIYDHKYIHNIAVRINTKQTHTNKHTFECSEDQNIHTNLQKLSQIIIERMNGNYENTFDYTNESQKNGMSEGHSLESSQNDSQYIKVSIEDSNNENNNGNINGPGYGSISHAMDESENMSQRSRIGVLVTSIGDVTQQMKDKFASMSISSLKSFATNAQSMSEDKFVDYETMPLIGSTTSLVGGQYRNNYRQMPGFCGRNKKYIAISITIFIVVYIVISLFCGFAFDACKA